MKEHTGALVTFEGVDGVGKTTEITLAQSALVAAGYNVHVTRAHGGTPIGEALRNVSLDNDLQRNARTDLFISMAMHSELQQDIKERRSRGEIILLDRGSLSMWAYQVYGSGLPAEEAAPYIDADNREFNSDLIICYQATLKTVRDRMKQSTVKADYYESQPDAFFERVIAGYEFGANRYGAARINAERTVDEVHVETMRAINQLFT